MNRAAEVCWTADRDDEGNPIRRQSWRTGKPKSTPPAENAEQVDIYSHERAGLMERLCILAGVTTWREPVGGFTNKPGKIPPEHVLAAALAFARDRSGKARDIGPDILESLVLGKLGDRGEYITTKLLHALLDVSARMHAIHRPTLRKACRRVVAGCVEGVPVERLNAISAHDWRFIESLGTTTIWNSAEQTLKEVGRVLGR